MHNARTRQVLEGGIKRQQAVKQGATPIAWRGMHHQVRRLVDDQHMLIRVHHIERHRLRLKSLALWCGPQFDRAGVCHLDPGRRLSDRSAVERDRTQHNQLLKVTAGELRHELGQGPVEAMPMLAGDNHPGS